MGLRQRDGLLLLAFRPRAQDMRFGMGARRSGVAWLKHCRGVLLPPALKNGLQPEDFARRD
ncbi:hypothetical protein CEK69_00135 [Xanthomonas sp. LMG 12462]|nr:hypothetical protein CEK69_00135 [Xanthomonas sp. LMG 12462]